VRDHNGMALAAIINLARIGLLGYTVAKLI
jgi:hypothetical protein